MMNRFPDIIRDVRGMGLMLGVELSGDAGEVAAKLRDRNVLVNVTNRTVLRIVPPLNIGEEHIREFLKAFEGVLSGG